MKKQNQLESSPAGFPAVDWGVDQDSQNSIPSPTTDGMTAAVASSPIRDQVENFIARFALFDLLSGPKAVQHLALMFRKARLQSMPVEEMEQLQKMIAFHVPRVAGASLNCLRIELVRMRMAGASVTRASIPAET